MTILIIIRTEDLIKHYINHNIIIIIIIIIQRGLKHAKERERKKKMNKAQKEHHKVCARPELRNNCPVAGNRGIDILYPRPLSCHQTPGRD